MKEEKIRKKMNEREREGGGMEEGWVQLVH